MKQSKESVPGRCSNVGLSQVHIYLSLKLYTINRKMIQIHPLILPYVDVYVHVDNSDIMQIIPTFATKTYTYAKRSEGWVRVSTGLKKQTRITGKWQKVTTPTMMLDTL